jgi:predicted acetyltransferase
MCDVIDVKTVEADDFRAAHTLFRASMHQPPADDARWALAGESFLPGRVLGAYADGRLVGTTMSLPLPMTVPGGGVLPSAAVTRVGVRADHTRRGALTALMNEQLAAVAAAGEPIASLRSSEYPIYGRYGYGVATRGRDLQVDPRRAAFHPGAPVVGEVRLIDRADQLDVLPALYRRLGQRRPGAMGRERWWWRLTLERPGGDEVIAAAVHTGPDGDDGFVVYRPEKNSSPEDPWGTRLEVDDLQAADQDAAAALWRFLLRVDVTNQVRAWLRPLDEPLPLLLADPRAARTTEVGDEAWLRLVDVPRALNGRSWAGSDAVVLAVHDAQLPANSGHYVISPDGVVRTDRAAQLACDVAVLARLYLGDVAPSALAASGWLTVPDRAALPAADALFATATVPWCGTFF